jgi:hypothetical protein
MITACKNCMPEPFCTSLKKACSQGEVLSGGFVYEVRQLMMIWFAYFHSEEYLVRLLNPSVLLHRDRVDLPPIGPWPRPIPCSWGNTVEVGLCFSLSVPASKTGRDGQNRRSWEQQRLGSSDIFHSFNLLGKLAEN